MSRLQSGERLEGRFQVHRVIGTGDLGEVYEVWDQTAGKLAAAKLITHPGATDAILAQIEQLASRAAQASQAFVPVARGMSAQGPYLVREFIKLPSLARTVDKKKGLPLPVAAELVGLLAPVLDAVHTSGLAHGDLSPGNIFVPGSPTETPKITDFGIISLRAAAPSPWPGIPGWIAPEQAKSGVATAAGDIYTLAALAFYAVVAVPYFRHARGVNPDIAALWQEMHGAVDAVARAAENGVTLPAEFDAVFARALTPQPEQRYARASEFAQAFRVAAARAKNAKPPPGSAFDGTLVINTEEDDVTATAIHLAGGTPRPAAGTPRPAAGTPRPAGGTPRPAGGTPRPAAGTPPPAAGAPRPAAGMPPPAVALGGGGEPPLVSAPPMLDEDEQRTMVRASPLAAMAQSPKVAPPPEVAPPPVVAPQHDMSGTMMVQAPLAEFLGLDKQAPKPTSAAVKPTNTAVKPTHDAVDAHAPTIPPASRQPLEATSYALSAFDAPHAVGDNPEVVLRRGEPLFGKRHMLVIAGVVAVVFVLGALGIWLLLKMDQPVNFPTAASAQPK